MRKLTAGEIKLHQIGLKQIKERVIRAGNKYVEGDITKKKYDKIKADAKEEERNYLRNSGVIFFFGNYFRADS